MKCHLSLIVASLALWSRAAMAEPPAPPQDSGATLRTAGWITAGCGAAAVAGSAVFWGLALHEHSEMSHPPEPSYAYHERAFARDATVSRIMGLVGLAAVGTGVTLVLVAPTKAHEVRVTAGLGDLSLSGLF
jgi:hypothetical protein